MCELYKLFFELCNVLKANDYNFTVQYFCRKESEARVLNKFTSTKPEIMKSKLIILSLTAFTAAAILSACNSTGTKGDTSQGYKDSLAQANNVVIDTTNTVKKDWEKFKSDADNKIRQNQDSISIAKKRIEKEDAKIKVKYRKMIVKLEERNNNMEAKLKDYKDEGKDKLEKFRADFNNSMDSIGTDIKDLFKNDKK